jgi:uncharacterized protein YuzE
MRLIERAGNITIEWASDVNWDRCTPVSMVADFAPDGTIVGVEILEFQIQAGATSFELCPLSPSDPPRVAYDDDSDSFYLLLRNSTSSDQRSVDGCVARDSRNRLLGLRVDSQGQVAG